MKILAYLGLFALVLCMNCKNLPTDLYYQMKGFTQKEHPLDATHYYKKISDNHDVSHVYFGRSIWEQTSDPKFRFHLLEMDQNAVESCIPESYPDYFKFFSREYASLNSVNNTAEIDSPCFTKTHFTYSRPEKNTVLLTVETEDSTSLLCTDNYLFATPNDYHFDAFEFKGKHEIYFRNLSTDSMLLMENYGLKVFRFCDSIANFIPDVIMTMYLFLGNPGGMVTKANVPPSKGEAEANIEFIKQAAGFQLLPRNTTINVGKSIDQSYIKSGDFVFVIRLDGLDPMEIWCTGPGPGHSTIALWGDDGVLYILESQDANYWPRPNIQKNNWTTWIQWAENAGYNVGVLPLRQDLAEKFNATAAWEWFDTVEGHPYGYHNYLFSWFDTPLHSFPTLINGAFFAEIWTFIEKIKPSLWNSMFGQAINKRLKTTGLNMSQIALKLVQNNMTFADVMAIPENDTWIYNDGVSLTCACFVIAVYRAAGLFEGTEIFVTEFTPRDVVMLNFWNFNVTDRPQICKEADPNLPYCQLMGEIQMFFPDIMNTVDIYSHMNEKCETVAPEYLRIPQNC